MPNDRETQLILPHLNRMPQILGVGKISQKRTLRILKKNPRSISILSDLIQTIVRT